MKNYLEIYLGSRGVLEGVEMVGREDIERYLEIKSEENKSFIEEGDEEELGNWGWEKLKEGVYDLGLGEEEKKFYIDIELKEYKEWGKDWMNINENDIQELLRECLWEWNEREEE